MMTLQKLESERDGRANVTFTVSVMVLVHESPALPISVLLLFCSSSVLSVIRPVPGLLLVGKTLKLND